MSNFTVDRRQNALALVQDYAEKALARGIGPKRLEQAIAAYRSTHAVGRKELRALLQARLQEQVEWVQLGRS